MGSGGGEGGGEGRRRRKEVKGGREGLGTINMFFEEPTTEIHTYGGAALQFSNWFSSDGRACLAWPLLRTLLTSVRHTMHAHDVYVDTIVSSGCLRVARCLHNW